MSVVINGDTGISGVNGSAATPAIQGGDADTGIFFGTNTASIATGGASRLHINSAGDVGIGVTDPDCPLSILCDGNANGVKVRGRSADDIGQIVFLENDGTTEIGRIQSRQEFLQLRARQSGQSITFVTNGIAERMRLSAGGRLGLNNTNPDALGTGRLVIGNGSDSERITIYTSSSTNGAIHFADGDTGQDRFRGYIAYNHSDNSMVLATNDVERLRLDGTLNKITGAISMGNGQGGGSTNTNGGGFIRTTPWTSVGDEHEFLIGQYTPDTGGDNWSGLAIISAARKTSGFGRSACSVCVINKRLGTQIVVTEISNTKNNMNTFNVSTSVNTLKVETDSDCVACLTFIGGL